MKLTWVWCGAALLALSCQGGNEKYEAHATRTMSRWANAEPTVAPGDFVPPVDTLPAPDAQTLAGLAADAAAAPDSPVETAAPLPAPSVSAGNQPEHAGQTGEIKAEMLKLSLEFEGAAALSPGATGTLRFQITALRAAAEIRVRYEVEGPAVATPSSSVIGSGPAGRTLLAITRVELKPGRSKVTAVAEGYDSAGQKLFAGSKSLYCTVEDGKVQINPEELAAPNDSSRE